MEAYWLWELEDEVKETRGGNPCVVEPATSSSLIRLDDGIGPSRGEIVPERNVGDSCELSRLVRGRSCVEVTADEGRLWPERRAIRSGCIPVGGWVEVEALPRWGVGIDRMGRFG